MSSPAPPFDQVRAGAAGQDVDPALAGQHVVAAAGEDADLGLGRGGDVVGPVAERDDGELDAFDAGFGNGHGRGRAQAGQVGGDPAVDRRQVEDEAVEARPADEMLAIAAAEQVGPVAAVEHDTLAE